MSPQIQVNVSQTAKDNNNRIHMNTWIIAQANIGETGGYFFPVSYKLLSHNRVKALKDMMFACVSIEMVCLGFRNDKGILSLLRSLAAPLCAVKKTPPGAMLPTHFGITKPLSINLFI